MHPTRYKTVLEKGGSSAGRGDCVRHIVVEAMSAKELQETVQQNMDAG